MPIDRVLTLLTIAALGYLIVLACRHWPEPRRVWLGRALAFALCAYAATVYFQMAAAGALSISYALPSNCATV